MATEMLSPPTDPFRYLLTCKFPQDHIELLFSCIRSRGGWNNNPNCLQMKYALRKMFIRNAITASKNANCVTSQDVIQSSPCFISENTTKNCSSARYHAAQKAFAFTHFINKGGLKIPSSSVYRTVEYSGNVFKAVVSGKDGNEISNQANLKERLVIQVNKHCRR